MRTFTYTAREGASGQKVTAEIDAVDETAASKLLTQRGLSPLKISVKTDDAVGSFRERVSTKQRVIFSRQLSTLTNAGLPLVQSLSTVGEQVTNKTLKQIVSNIVNDIEGGSSFSDALARYPRVFDNVYISLIAAGETSGTLDKSLERLANQQEKDAEIVSKVRGAMIYPAIVIMVLIGVVIFMMTTVLPQVESFYKSLPGAKLPFITVWLLAVAHFMTHLWWLIILAVIGGGYFFARWARTIGGKDVLDTFKLRFWLIKPLFMKLYMARFARTGSTLIASGVPMLKMLNTSAEAVGNVHVAASVHRAAEQVKGGKTLSDSLRGDPYFLSLVPDMIRIGEQSGALEGMLAKVADYYEKEVDNQIKTISTVIEPALMILVGIFALIIVAAVLLPIYSLAGKGAIHF